jgi:hypothetical protein
MKQKLEQLSNSAMTLISEFALKGDAPTITRIAAIATRIHQLQEQLQHIEQEIPQIDQKLKTFTPAQPSTAPQEQSPASTSDGNGLSGKKKLHITVDWTCLGKPGGKQIICEHMSSHTMAKWAARLYEQFGLEPLRKLAKFKINRGPMVSTQPQSDYTNKANGSVYAHQPVSDSGYYILTHSPISQKLTDIPRACQTALGFPIGSVVVAEADKNGYDFTGIDV